MTREEIIEQYPIALAEKEGKKIQYYCDGKWIDCVGSVIYGQEKLRVKPEQTKRLPTIEEVEKWFLENKVFLYKCTNTFYRIESFTKHPKQVDKVIYVGEWNTIKEFCEDHSHYDGSELYITE